MIYLKELKKELSKEKILSIFMDNFVLYIACFLMVYTIYTLSKAFDLTEISDTDKLIVGNIMMTCFVGLCIFVNEIIKNMLKKE